MEDLRRCWKVPYIVYYCNLFEQKLDLIDLRVDEFEEALIDDCGNERNITIVHLLQKLIKPFTNRSIDLTNFDQYLLQVLRRYHLDFILTNADREQTEDSKSAYNSWNNLTILAKLDIIFKLCELRLSLHDIESKLNDYEANELRLEPLAVDSEGTRLWYFGDLRLYEEKKPQKKPKNKIVKKKVEKKPTRSTRSSRRLRAKEEEEEEWTAEEAEELSYESDEDIDVEELDNQNYEQTLRKELKYWSCVCASLEDWHEINERFKNSDKKQDQEIGELLESQYLPEMPGLFQKAEREKQQRLQAMQPKRQSQRLQSKQTSHLSENEADDDFSKLPPEEQERVRREQIARAREQRLKQRLAKRETNLPNDSLNADEISQDGQSVRSNDSKSSDFNIKNYFLMYKVLQKLLQCKYAWPFKTAVSEEDAPDYNTIIQSPMDLSTIQLKINNKIYKSRKEFISDLELIVQNCLTYNGDDTFYGKLAVKFENFFKRWLQIFYPREISASLEEKNRQLMKLINGSDMSAENGEENTELTGGEAGPDEETNSVSQINENSQLTENDTTQPIDFSDASFLNGTVRKKRKPNPDKDKYIQEPEYVTKRTSSGRLVKMKINNEFDYASDEDKERPGPGRPRKRDLDYDDGTQEGIQQRHCKSPNQLNRYVSSSDSADDDDDDDDDEFTAKSKPKNPHKKTTRKYVRKRDQFGNLIPRRPKKTIADLTGPATPALAKIFESSQEENGVETKRNVISNTNILRQQSSNLNLKQQNSEYTFEQYVKKINSNCTVGQALAVADAVKAACTNSPDKNQSPAHRLSIKINPASTSHAKMPLNIPIINPSIRATLNRAQLNQHQHQQQQQQQQQQPQQPLIVNNSNENNKVKLISLNGNSGGVSGKKLLIINSNASNQTKPVILNNGGASNFKIINIKSTSSPVGSPKPVIMINKSLNSDETVKIENDNRETISEAKNNESLSNAEEISAAVGTGPEQETPVDTISVSNNESEVNGHVN